jgi:hypothetical protein
MLNFPTVLHPYYKLQYIKLAWGGEKEQAEERAAGNRNAKNWQDEAKQILESMVRVTLDSSHWILTPFFADGRLLEDTASSAHCDDADRYP